MTSGTGYGTPSPSAVPASGSGYGIPSGFGYGTPSGFGYGIPDTNGGDSGSDTNNPDTSDDKPADGSAPDNSFESISKIKLSLKNAIKASGKKGDKLIGTDSSDTIVSGKGVDTMVGKDGADYFVYKQKKNFGKKKADKVIDFDSNDGDTIIIKGKSFSSEVKKEATFAQASNKKQAKKLAKQDVDFIYEKKKGRLYFNSNGESKGFGDQGGFFGILKGSPDLTIDDINLI